MVGQLELAMALTVLYRQVILLHIFTGTLAISNNIIGIYLLLSDYYSVSVFSHLIVR